MERTGKRKIQKNMSREEGRDVDLTQEEIQRTTLECVDWFNQEIEHLSKGMHDIVLIFVIIQTKSITIRV